MAYRPPMRGKGSSPRVVFRHRLRIAKSFVESMVRTLDNYSGKIYVPNDERAPGDYFMRERREGEFMEEKPEAFRALASDLDMMATYFANEARNARAIADMIEKEGVCPRVPSPAKKAS